MYVYMYVLQIHIGMCLGILGWLRIPRCFWTWHQVVGPLTDEGFVQVQLKSSKAEM